MIVYHSYNNICLLDENTSFGCISDIIDSFVEEHASLDASYDLEHFIKTVCVESELYSKFEIYETLIERMT